MDNIGLMSETVNFIQGSKKNYDSSTMQGGVYFSKDSKEILLNGESYGNAVPADEEDLTSVNGALQLKDREVNADNFQSKGYVILRKNIVDGKNVLTQDMINQPNTIYEIRYDFDLDNEKISLQEGSSLNFSGGLLKRGILDGLSFYMVPEKKIFEDIQLVNFIGNIQAIWFGVIANDSSKEESNSLIIQSLLKYNCPVIFPEGTVYCSNIIVDNSISISGKVTVDINHKSGINSHGTILRNNGNPFFILFKNNQNMIKVSFSNLYCTSDLNSGVFLNTTNSELKNADFSCTLKNVYFEGFDYVIKHNAYGTYLNIQDCTFRNIRTAVSFDLACNLGYISNCNFLNVAQCIKVYGSNLLINHCEFNLLYTGEDWEDLILWCLNLKYSATVQHIYTETYGSHDSLYSNSLFYVEDSSLVNLTIKDVTFGKYKKDNKQLNHFYFLNNSTEHFVHSRINISRSHNNSIPTQFGSNLEDIVIKNIFIEDNPIISDSVTGGYGPIIRYFQEGEIKTSNKNLNWFNLVLEPKYDVYQLPSTLSLYKSDTVWVDGLYDINLDLFINKITDQNGNLIFGLTDFYIIPYKFTTEGFKYPYHIGVFKLKRGGVRITANLKSVAANNGLYLVIKTTGNSLVWNNNMTIEGRINLYCTPVTNELSNLYKYRQSITDSLDSTLVASDGDSTNRPSLTISDKGFEYYDTTLNKQIIWNGTEWTNIDGTSLDTPINEWTTIE